MGKKKSKSKLAKKMKKLNKKMLKLQKKMKKAGVKGTKVDRLDNPLINQTDT
jgi:DNA-binding protein YbaB